MLSLNAEKLHSWATSYLSTSNNFKIKLLLWSRNGTPHFSVPPPPATPQVLANQAPFTHSPVPSPSNFLPQGWSSESDVQNGENDELR